MPSPRDTHLQSGTVCRGWPLAFPMPLLVALLSAGFIAMPLASAVAQTATPEQQAAAATASPEAIKQREQEREAAREQQKKAAELQEKLKADMAAIGQDRSKLNQQLIDIAGQVRSVETRIG